ncbi:MAG: 50S ribosome-binding GTPase [Nanoarchaeota archaeon]|nr:50S ribosome-binding GTPase [Nanoarchaeota archaeon]
MASTNQSPFYKKAEEKFLQAKTNDEKLEALREMIKECPKHKSSEKMLANLKTRLKKLETQITKSKKSGKSSKIGIRKEDMQAIIIGLTNSGKSSLLSLLTNTDPQIADYNFTTKNPIIGMMDYLSTQIQIIENPAIDSDYYDKGLVNTADTLLILITNLEQIKKIEEKLSKTIGKRIIVFNKIDKLNQTEKRKLSATLQSKKYNFVLISTKTQEGIEELKNKIFNSFDKIRVYTKEPGKEKSKKPIVMVPRSTVKDVAEKILKGFSEKVKETKIWGPSSKFPGQKIGLTHKLKDLDVVEFKTR